MAMTEIKDLASPHVFTRVSGSLVGKIAYWTFTALIAWEMALGAYWDLFEIQYVRDVFTHLHLPFYFLIIMGIWKLPCAVVLLMPRVPRLKEWAYAGAFFTYSGAAVLHISVGDHAGGWAAPALYALFTVASWALRPASRRLVADPEKKAGRSGRSKMIGYWIATAVMAFVLISGGVAELTEQTYTIKGMLSLGYPVYFTLLLGCWKITGGIVLLVPRWPLVKEWAYFGIFLDMSGAFMTHIACHSEAQHLIWTGIFSVLTVVSWALRPDSRKIS